MNRIDRLFGILTFIQSRKFTSIDRIADKFHISKRTAYRDVKAIGEQGIPLGFETNKGYFVMDGFYLPPVSFTTEEANAMLLMESIVKGFADKSIRKHYSSALDKIKGGLQSEEKEKLESLSKRIRLQVPECFVMDSDFLSVLQEAITAQHQIIIDYKNNKEEISNRQLEPLGLLFYAMRWHLIAWCHLRKDYRDFKVISIMGMKNTRLHFTIKKHMTLSEYQKTLSVDY
ncbi:MAG: YafY family protein [bacterium]|nr:YafY family protein [bacterium]